ncbi:3'-5' exonuclease [Thiopseudomonas alkaliphila]|uniref:3'-5' exonuclease n=1 Tax=Thiopseudomonas alkaliphila TaxID=1697053 RepID=UPI00069D7B88|nr:3'-5' exonuclease [Thiopseudomonas alkaliphila]AKX53071.1 hypothetical protein AKN91_04845 [Thiopseudomonas alkaliphila]
MFDINRFAEIQANPSRFRLLEQIPFSAEDCCPIKLRETVGDEIALALLDFETTGFTAGNDEVIELGLVQVAYSPSLEKITEIIEITSQLECPKQAISELITSITGISNEMVAGKRIDDAHVTRIVNSSNVLIAHNAQFDRAFFDIRFPEMANKVWACSVKDIDWRAHGFESSKLEYLLLKNGYFYEGHRAATDCLAMVQLFASVPNALPELLANAQKASFKILAKGVAYADREVVKKRGYRWDADNRHWWTIVSEDAYAEETAFLNALCGTAAAKNVFEKISQTSRYVANS